MNTSFKDYWMAELKRDVSKLVLAILAFTTILLVLVQYFEGPSMVHKIEGNVVSISYSYAGSNVGIDKSRVALEIANVYSDGCFVDREGCDTWNKTSFEFPNDSLEEKIKLGTLVGIECTVGPYQINLFKGFDRTQCRITSINKLQP